MLAGLSAAAALVAFGVAVVSVGGHFSADRGHARRGRCPCSSTLLIALGWGGRADGLVLVEAVAMIALIFLAVRPAPAAGRWPPYRSRGLAEAAMIAVGGDAGARSGRRRRPCAFWSLGAAGAAGAALHLNALDAERARSVADARRSQRLELARDLHDFVAHDVSAILVDAQAGRMVGANAPEHALAALGRIEEDALRALAAMDRTVRALREAGDDPTGTEQAQMARRSKIWPSWPAASRRAHGQRCVSTSRPKRSTGWRRTSARRATESWSRR